jgi:hypothetical protein
MCGDQDAFLTLPETRPLIRMNILVIILYDILLLDDTVYIILQQKNPKPSNAGRRP